MVEFYVNVYLTTTKKKQGIGSYYLMAPIRFTEVGEGDEGGVRPRARALRT